MDAIKQMGRNKAAGPSGITLEHYALTGKESPVIKGLQIIYNMIIKGSQIPEVMNESKIILLAKTSEVNGNLNQTRPITLIETDRKILRE